MNRKMRICLAGMFVFAVLVSSGFSAIPRPEAAPVRSFEEINVGQDSAEGLPKGFQPNPVMPPTLRPSGVLAAPPVFAPPASLDWRWLNGVTAVKNQNPWGTCFIFAGVGDLESKVKIAETPPSDPDYAEQNVLEGFHEGYNNLLGGHTQQIANHFSLYASIHEAANPYNPAALPATIPVPGFWNPPAGTPLNTIFEWHSLGDLDTLATATTLKNYIQAHGPVAASVRVDRIKIWSSTVGQPMFDTMAWDSDIVIPYLTTAQPPDHSILIVGWDDNKPYQDLSGNGAWLVKNSWGTAWGRPSADAGYFWIAYGSARIGAQASYYPKNGYEPYDSNSTLLAYDLCGGSYGAAGFTGIYNPYGLACYTPTFTGDRYLKHVEFWSMYQNLNYQIRVWDDFNRSTGARTNQLGATVSGSLGDAGYYRVDLPVPAPLTSGDEIAIEMQFINPANSWAHLVPYEMNMSWYSNGKTDEQAKCYLSHDGSVWQDMNALATPFGDVGIRGRIEPGTAPTLTVAGGVACVCGQPASSGDVAIVNDPEESAGTLQVQASGMPTGLSVTLANNSGVIRATVQADMSVTPNTYPITLTVTDRDSRQDSGAFNATVYPPPTRAENWERLR